MYGDILLGYVGFRVQAPNSRVPGFWVVVMQYRFRGMRLIIILECLGSGFTFWGLECRLHR